MKHATRRDIEKIIFKKATERQDFNFIKGFAISIHFLEGVVAKK